jgi:hypothetical protein
MHGPELRHEALRLIAGGLSDGAAARLLSLPRTTVRDWRRLADRPAPERCPRGCIRTDGCVFVNRTGPYEYLSYEFCNYSPDILDIFVGVCELVGLRPRRYPKRARLCRREDVALLLQHVGTKERLEPVP